MKTEKHPPIAPETNRKTIPLSPILLVLLTACGVYLNALFNDFVFDDVQNILGNRWIKDPKFIPEIFSSPLAGFDKGFATSYYRPLVHILYMMNYHIFGPVPWGFHLVNILFHAGVSVLVFLLITELLGEYQTLSCLTAALLFAAHPIHTESVTWAAGLMDLSFAFFYLLSLYLYIRSCDRSQSWKGIYALSVGSFFIATLCKEPALTLPVILIAYDSIIGRPKGRLFGAFKRYIPYLIAAGVYFLMRWNALGGLAPSKKSIGLSGYEYVINIFPLFMHYLEKLLLPIHLNVLYTFHPITSILETRGMGSLAFTMTFILLAYLSFKRNKKAFLCLIIMVVPLLPALYIPALGEGVFAERYLYLPSFGFAAACALFVGWVRKIRPEDSLLLTVALLAIIAAYSMGTIRRNAVWKDSYSLWADTVKKSPDSGAAHQYLGYTLYTQGRIDEAIKEYQISLGLDPDRADTHVNLGASFAVKGRLEQAIGHYQIALTLNPDFTEAHNNLGLAYSSTGLIDEAIKEYQTALKCNPYFDQAHNNLGIAYVYKGLMDHAIVEFESAIKLNPDNPDYHANLSKALEILWADHPLRGR